MRKISILIASALAASATAATSHAANPLAGLPAGWSHATVNVLIKRKPHTLIYDRGRVTAITASSLTLKERDGSVVTVNVSPSAQIVIAGVPGTLAQIRRQEIATTMSIDGAPVTSVKVQIPPAVAAAIAKQQSSGTTTVRRRRRG